MNREAEFLSKHKDALKKARECCERLKLNADHDTAAPRGALYLDLAFANKELEGTCRQMFHWRGDDARWLRLGAVYANAAKLAAKYLRMERWRAFGELAKVYELGLRRVDDLGDRPNGRLGKLILPGDISPWFVPPKDAVLH